MAMCMPLANGAAGGALVTLQFRAYAVLSDGSSDRLPAQLASTNWLMLDAGRSVGDRHFFNVELMATAERWTLPAHGYAELLQTGEAHADGSAYIDAQHPHSSPIMALTFSDTLNLTSNGRRSVQLFFSPRGASTDGPIAYMHRASARHNPDAPLGHHLAQDVGHISSTVLGAALTLGSTTLELSGFHGAEPSPTHVDLPLGRLNSLALRVTREFRARHQFMASYAYVGDPEHDAPGGSAAIRGSASLYDQFARDSGWAIDHMLVAGRLLRRPEGQVLYSLLDELHAQRDRNALWARLELLQRTGTELLAETGASADRARWVSALTLGATRRLAGGPQLALSLGAALTVDWLPGAFAKAYGTRTPVTARLYLQFERSGRHGRVL